MNMTNLVADMTETPLHPVMVSLRGIEGISRKSLAFLFSSQKTTQYEIVEEHPQAIKIIDIDDYRGQSAWDSLQVSAEEPNSAPVVVLGREPVTIENGISLQKPFRPRELLAALETLANKITKTPEVAISAPAVQEQLATDDKKSALGSSTVDASAEPSSKGLSQSAASSLNEREIHSFIGTTQDVDLTDPEAIAQIQFDPGQFLAERMLELIKLAAREHKYIRIGCCDVAFYIDPQQRCIRTLVKEKNLRTFGTLPLDFKTFAYHREHKLPVEIEAHGFRFSYEDFIWRMVLAGSRGRLPENIDLDQRFVLRRWPNLTRLLLFPHATQISAAWIASPKSIKEIVAQLAVPQRFVFAFFAVTHMMEYLTPVEPSSQPVSEPIPEQQHKSRGLFRRLLKTLYRKKG